MELIASYTATSPVSSISFTSVAPDWTDLVLVISGRVTRATTFSTIVMKFNGSSSDYSTKSLTGNGSAASSGGGTGFSSIASMEVPANNATANTFGNHIIYIPNAFGSSYKSVSIDAVSETNATTAYSNIVAGLWSNSAAITSVALTEPNGGSNFATNSTAYLYGVSNA